MDWAGMPSSSKRLPARVNEVEQSRHWSCRWLSNRLIENPASGGPVPQ
jgi:hypothetical protein